MKNNEILALHEDFLETYRSNLDRIAAIDFSKTAAASLGSEGDRPWYSPYNVENGVGFIPVSGSLVNWPVAFSMGGLATTYDYIAETYSEMMNDSNVNEIVLDIDSHGGTVSGVFETVAIMKSGKTKKVTARTKTMATSAAYMVAAVADEIIAQESALVGSIGVLSIHQSYRKMLEDDGIKVTVVKSGEQKAEGNPYEDLSEEALKRLKSQVDTYAMKFAQLVSTARGISVEDVIKMEAAAMPAEKGIHNGLVDKISLVNDKVMSYTEKNRKKETLNMTETKQPEVDVAKLQQQAAASAQARIQGILNSEAAQGREELAKTIAFTTSVTVEQAVALLQAAPKAEQKLDFEKLMLNSQNPEVGAGHDGGSPKQLSVEDATAYWAKTLFGIKKGA